MMMNFEFILSSPSIAISLSLSLLLLLLLSSNFSSSSVIWKFDKWIEEDTSFSSSSPSSSLVSWSLELEKISRIPSKGLQVSALSWFHNSKSIHWFFECFLHKKLIGVLLNGLMVFRFKRGLQVGGFHLKFKLTNEVLAN